MTADDARRMFDLPPWPTARRVVELTYPSGAVSLIYLPGGKEGMMPTIPEARWPPARPTGWRGVLLGLLRRCERQLSKRAREDTQRPHGRDARRLAAARLYAERFFAGGR